MSRESTFYHNKVTVVVGGASGIGRALCLALAQHGAVVVIADLDVAAAEQVAESIRDNGQQANTYEVDATSAVQSENLMTNVIANHERIDYLFNTAGMGIWGDVRDVTEQQWHLILDANFWSVVRPTLAAYRKMAQCRSGHIVNLASLSGLLPVPTTIPYTAAKHAVVGFSLSLRDEAAGLGVKISVACPGPVQSEFHRRILLVDENSGSRKIPDGAIDVDTAADEILSATLINQRLVVFPSRFRWKWRFASWLPGFWSRKAQAAANRMRNKKSR